MLLISCALLALAACHQAPPAPANESAPAAEAGPVKGVDRSHEGRSAPAVAFDDGNGGTISLEGEHPTPVLVNLWATWCAPCVKELPTLDRLSQTENGIVVMAVNQDSAPHASVEAFLKQHEIGRFAAFQDSKMALSGGFGAEVLPTTILLDSKGKEVWRYVGDLDWTSAEAAKLLSEAGGPKKG
jgi:thiol-disulfide isomerase/thioredoxin